MPRYDADWIDSLLKPERRGSPPADEILNHLQLREGMWLADVGCGPGFLTLPAASRVGPTGRVFAVDVETSMLDLVARRATEAGLIQIETRRPVDSRLPLADASVDLTLCSLVLHDLDDQTAFARELDRITRPDGRIAIIEWTPTTGDARPNRLAPAVIANLLRAVGRPPEPTIYLSEVQYLIVGQAKDRPTIP